ncbi:DUF2075 domain-containing protein [Candidatus Saccharibacteria bacterium]|nr:DUF2075 domain-containing protein [Candidatus Saccharibacteria bacterium]
MFNIDISNEIEFSEKTPEILDTFEFGEEKWPGKEWPVVYLIYNDTEVYVGETVDAKSRMAQHYAKSERRRLKSVVLISDGSFNKSVIQDLEAYLISHVAADSKFQKLQNGNSGFQKHAYYNCKKYEAEFRKVWDELVKRELARKSAKVIENSNIFKYSPYKTLTSDQYLVTSDIIRDLSDAIAKDKNRTFLVNGGAGTGKTVLGIYLAKLLVADISETANLEDGETVSCLNLIHEKRDNFRVGIVIPMSNLRTIVKNTFRHTYGLSSSMVLSPTDVANSKEKYDLLIVDEAHRLRRRRNIVQYKAFDSSNKKLSFSTDGTELDWILKQSKNQVFLYDSTQSIKPTDIPKEKIEDMKRTRDCRILSLRTQIRCNRGGERYVDYISRIFSNCPPKERLDFPRYDFIIYDDVSEMVEEIKKRNAERGLCRTVAGYAWDWRTKKEKLVFKKEDSFATDVLIKNGIYDIDIDGARFIWNTEYNGWLASPNSINEIGCIHTIQGFDLNYAGVIIGNELRYSEERGLYIDRKSYRDVNGSKSASDDELLEYILNIYKVLCTRGMLGTFVYVCDEGLRTHLQKYILRRV